MKAVASFKQGPQLAMVAMSQVLSLAVWFSSTAVLPGLEVEWSIIASQGAWLSMATQLGFVAGALGMVVTGLLDRARAEWLLGVSAVLASLLTLGFAFVATTLPVAIVLRFFTGFFLAGVYPTGLKLVSSWSLTYRARALSFLGGALTLGSALPYLINGLGPWPWRTVMVCTALACFCGGVLSIRYIRLGPYVENDSFKLEVSYAWTMFRESGPRAACLGYFGHMFELYAVWTWLPIFLMHSRGVGSIDPQLYFTVFAYMGIGGFTGCALAALLADRVGRQSVAAIALSISGLCCALSPLVFRASPKVQFLFVFIWGAAVIADSGIFSALLSSTVKRNVVGTALTMQTAIGFLITLVTIQLTPVMADIVGWQNAFIYLALGPLVGITAMFKGNSCSRLKGSTLDADCRKS
ncbi:MFS transporter [Caballeronia cordobensis]|uniref:MFS transporter n=1 Tax=Caballeronia cordobensis TaxID=1353886 RepID=UPI00045EE403|nr:putative membrane protein [Burkholderia sp. RPE67]